MQDLLVEEFVEGLWRLNAVKKGHEARNGEVLPVYLDLRKVVANAHMLKLAGTMYGDLLERCGRFHHISGIPKAGLPLMVAATLETGAAGMYYDADKQVIIGDVKPGEISVPLDDVLHDGGSKWRYIRAIENEGINVHDLVALFDHEKPIEGELAMLRGNYRVHAGFTMRKFLAISMAYDHIDAVLRDQALARLRT